jgi:hypothetical protein
MLINQLSIAHVAFDRSGGRCLFSQSVLHGFQIPLLDHFPEQVLNHNVVWKRRDVK